MKVFISWSGDKSHKVALVFREWLPSVIQSLEPYVSSEDIDKGARWSSDIAKELEDSSFGILCVTKDNLYAPWLSFEAGALSKTMDKAYVTPFLFDIKRSEVNGPILQFQSTVFEKEDIKKLMNTLNKACGENGITEAMLDKAFDVWYPLLKQRLEELKEGGESEETVYEIHENEQNYTSEIIEEILELARGNQKLLRNPDTKLNDDVESLKNQIDSISMKLEHNIGMTEKRMSRKYRTVFMDEIMHGMLPRCKKQTAFLIALSMVQERFPWIYNIGKELLQSLASELSVEEKRDAVRDFQQITDLSFNHPMTRDIEIRSKSDYMAMRDIEHMLLGLADSLLDDVRNV